MRAVPILVILLAACGQSATAPSVSTAVMPDPIVLIKNTLPVDPAVLTWYNNDKTKPVVQVVIPAGASACSHFLALAPGDSVSYELVAREGASTATAGLTNWMHPGAPLVTAVYGPIIFDFHTLTVLAGPSIRSTNDSLPPC